MSRRAVDTARLVGNIEAGSLAASVPTVGDPNAAAWLGQLHPVNRAPRVESGIIVDVQPGAYCYRVSAGIRSFLWCSPGGPSAGFSVSGAKPITSFKLGTRVWFVRDPETLNYGTILCAEPHWSVHNGFQPGDQIWPFIRTGQLVEYAHQWPLLSSTSDGMSGQVVYGNMEGGDFSAGRPMDSTAVGEWGAMTETGLGFFLDPFQAYMRVDEETGVFGFYHDQLLRVAGHNLQVRSTLKETEELHDEGELTEYVTTCIYPWEAMGLWRWNQVTPIWSSTATPNMGLAGGQGSKFNNPAVIQQGEVGHAVGEPESYTQAPAARIYSWGGYLGQGGHKVVAAPAQFDWAYPGAPGASGVVAGIANPSDAPASRLTVGGVTGPASQPLAVPANTRTSGPHQPGLFAEHTAVTGRHSLVTAHSLVFAKRASIPKPKLRRRAEDPSGDTSGTYAFSGLQSGSGVHVVKGTLGATGPRAACALPDAIAYLFNWENLHPFAYHEEDWRVPDEGAAGSDLVNQRTPDYSEAETDQYLSLPSPVFLDIDHRYGQTAYYETESVFAMLEDGGIVLRAGCGSEIRITQGNIELRPALDLVVYTGRDSITWAGRDIILRARDNADLTTDTGDIRTKAERNSHHLSGNSGCGGFLFENKATCEAQDYADKLGEEVESTGFVVLAPNSQVLMTAADIALTLDSTAPSDARITLAAGNSRSIHTDSKFLVSRVRTGGSVVQLFDDPEPTANEFTAAYSMIGNDLLVRDAGHFGGCLTATGTVGTAEARMATHGNFDDADVDIADRMTYLVGSYATAFSSQAVVPDGAENIEFSCRTMEQYATSNFVYWRSHWQQMAAEDSQTLNTWTMPVVTTLVSSVPTYPHPGERWSESGSLKYQPVTFVNTGSDGWVAVARDDNRSDYEAGNLLSVGSGTLSTDYKVTTG